MATWKSTSRAPERILVYGPMGGGKTNGAATIARRCLGPDDTMYVIDIDNSWTRVLDAQPDDGLKCREEWWGRTRDPEFEEKGGKLVVYHVTGWVDAIWAMEKVWARAGRGDWIVVDDATWLWADVQKWYVETTHGKEMPEFLMEHRKKESAKIEDGRAKDVMLIEWSYLNPVWNREVASRFVNAPCHLYVIAAGKPVRTDGRDRREVVDMYGGVGYKPESQWRLGGQMQTVLLLEKSVLGEWRYTTIKDREREEQERVPWTDLTMQYLRKVAGWKVGS